jgi:hypothetical protein
MYNTKTITSKHRLESEQRVNLSSLTDYRIETITIRAGTLVDILSGVRALDSDMRRFETAAIHDFLEFEKLD